MTAKDSCLFGNAVVLIYRIRRFRKKIYDFLVIFFKKSIASIISGWKVVLTN
jgi:hypothetical protein